MIQFADGWILIPSDPYQHLVSEISKVEGATPIPGGVALPGWKINFCIVEAFGSFVASDDYVNARRVAFSITPEELEQAKQMTDIQGLRDTLLDYQWQYLLHHGMSPAAFNASEQGTGKTPMAIAETILHKSKRVLLVGPRDVCDQWGDALPKFYSTMGYISLVTGTIEQRRATLKELRSADSEHNGGYMVGVNYEVVDSLETDLRNVGFDFAIMDESYRASNPNAKTTKAMIRLAKIIPVRRVLNGTPFGNDISRLWAQLKFLDPKLEPFAAWCKRFVQYEESHPNGRQIKRPVGCLDPAGLIRQLEPFWFRATKETCLNLPPITTQNVYFDMPIEMKAIYRRVVDEGVAVLGNVDSLADERTALVRLQQIAGGHIPVYTHQTTENEEEIEGYVYQPIECAKLRWVQRFIEEFCADPTRRVIIWCRFRAEVYRITNELREILGPQAVAYADGTVDPPIINEIKRLFNSRLPDTVRVLVAQIDKMNSGHNLQAGDVAIHYSHPWSFLKRSQADSRSHRHGREDRVDVYNLAYNDSIDCGILKAHRKHADLIERFTPETVGLPFLAKSSEGVDND